MLAQRDAFEKLKTVLSARINGLISMQIIFKKDFILDLVFCYFMSENVCV